MRTADVVKHFDENRAAIARACGITRAAVHKWGDLVPPLHAIRLEKATHGVLRLKPEEYLAKDCA
jgi:hypothetical protein